MDSHPHLATVATGCSLSRGVLNPQMLGSALRFSALAHAAPSWAPLPCARAKACDVSPPLSPSAPRPPTRGNDHPASLGTDQRSQNRGRKYDRPPPAVERGQVLDARDLVARCAVVFGQLGLNDDLRVELARDDEIGGLIEARYLLGPLGLAIADARLRVGLDSKAKGSKRQVPPYGLRRGMLRLDLAVKLSERDAHVTQADSACSRRLKSRCAGRLYRTAPRAPSPSARYRAWLPGGAPSRASL